MSAKGTVLKRVRQSIKAHTRNKNYKSVVKTVIKKANEAFSKIDKVASKGIINKRKAANQKSRISKHLDSLK